MAEPQVTSTDREERILARRNRIEERLKAKREGEGDGTKKEVVEEKEIGRGKQQVIEGRKRLNKLIEEGNAQVSSVRIAGDDRENRRRAEEETRRQELRGKLLAEAEQSARHNATVAMRWADLFGIEVPQELFEEIEQQRSACDKIIASKDRLIAEIKAELKAKDDEYVKALKRQAEDIDVLLGHMGAQFRELQIEYGQNLEEAEGAFRRERADLLAKHAGEIAELFEKRNAREHEFVEQSQERAEDFHRQLEELRVQDAEDYNMLKIRLERDVQNLEQHLEAMRATYQLNQEKLEYNYRVLVERDHENQSTIQQQKRKIARQRDVLSGLKGRYHSSDRRFQEDNMRLTDEYKRVTEQFKDLQAKFRHFSAADVRRRVDVRVVNAEQAAGLVRKVLESDKAIHEQVLGLGWLPPDDAVLAPPSEDEEATPSAAAPTSATELAQGGVVDTAQAVADEADSELDALCIAPRYAPLCALLAAEAGFLADARAQRAAAALPDDDFAARNTLHARAALRALGAASTAGLESLTVALAEDVDAAAADAAILGAEPDPHVPAKPLCDPLDVASRLKAFLDADALGGSPAAAAGAAAAASAAAARASRRAGGGEEEQYWARISNVVGKRGVRVWGALEQSLDKYHTLLSGRQKSLSEVASMRRQNEELRLLLNQYLSSKINEELRVPPTMVM